jgi:hypothetical protein
VKTLKKQVKGYENYTFGAIVVMLLPSRTDTKWIHKYVFGRSYQLFLQGRLKFGNSGNSAPFPSMLAIWGGNDTQIKVLAEDLKAYPVQRNFFRGMK